MRNDRRVVNPASRTTEFTDYCALALMTKAPRPGEVKTRLVPPLTKKEAAQLNKCFLKDTSNSISVCCSDLAALSPDQAMARGIAVYTPVGAESDYMDILPVDFSLLPQRGQNFGERLYFAAEDLFRCGFDSVCLIDSDSPTIPTENFARAVKILSLPGDHIVLGPCDDGGYYLIGLKRLRREFFEGIDWSTELVLQQTKHHARECGVGVHELPRGFDVDDRATLQRLCEKLLGENTPDTVAPRTQEFLRELIASDGRRRIWPK